MSALDVVLLILHAAVAVVVIRTATRTLLPALHALGDGEDAVRAYEIWVPLALSAPLAVASVSLDDGAKAAAAGVAVPVAAAMIGFGAAMLAPQAGSVSAPQSNKLGRALIATAAAGLLLLLLAATNRLSSLAGQVIICIWAVVLWLNSPPHRPSREDAERSESSAAGGALAVIALLTIIHSTVGAFVSAEALPVFGVLCVLEAAVLLSIIRFWIDPTAAARVASWLVVYGVLLAIGVVSFATLLRASWPFRDREANLAIMYGVAHGYARFAIEAVLLLVLPSLFFIRRFLPPGARRFLAWMCIGGGAVLAGTRLSGL